jgi:hypothetical protein
MPFNWPIEGHLSLRDWSLWRVLLLGIGWVILVLVIALPRVLRFMSGRATDGSGGLVGISFGRRWADSHIAGR